MNRQQDIERVLDAWFVDGSSRMPDRLFDAVLDEVGRMPQRRRPWSYRKVRPMSLQVRLAAAAAVIVLIGGTGLFVLTNRPADSNVGVTPSPSVSLSPRPPDAALPAELEHYFLAPKRNLVGAPLNNQDRAIVSFVDGMFEFNDGLLRSTATATAAGEIRLVATADSDGCNTGAEGIWTWTLSPGGTKLTLTGSEECLSRAAVLEGDDWLRSDCPNPDNFCLGNLEAGDYSSQYIDPYVPIGSQWYARFGALTYTVPDGWANTSDFPTNYTLQQQGATDESGIFVYSEFVIIENDESCTELPEPGVGRDATAMATYLADHEGIVASDPVATTIGGLSGVTMLLEMDPAWTRSCPFITDGTPVVPLFTDPDAEEGGMAHALLPDSQMRLYLLDLGDGRSLVIVIEGHGEAAWQALIEEATSVVESMQFPR
jgi:hypothetical protein